MARGLQDEIKQTRPWGSLEEEAMLNISRTSALLDHALTQAFKPHHITPTQYNVLRILRGAGSNGLCRMEIGERLVRPVPDVTRLLDRMEQTGWIRRHRGGTDRRFVTTVIAPKGLALLTKLDDEIGAIHRQQIGHLGAAELRQLVDLLTIVRHRPDG
jgi:DNA-binding MarR family transcriptional regulator